MNVYTYSPARKMKGATIVKATATEPAHMLVNGKKIKYAITTTSGTTAYVNFYFLDGEEATYPSIKKLIEANS
jgi:hypothetical protein